MVQSRKLIRRSVIPLPIRTAEAPRVADRRSASAPWSELSVPTSHGRITLRIGGGQGVPLLFLHGNSMGMDLFRALMAGDLWTSCRMIALDLPGHGASDDVEDPDRTYSIPGFAEAVIEVLERLDIPRVAIVGWSLGGHIALEIATRYPGVLGVMLCGTSPVGTAPEALAAGYRPGPMLDLWRRTELTPAEAGAFAHLMVGRKAHRQAAALIARTDSRARHQTIDHLLRGAVPDQRAIVERTRIPVAVVIGEDDPVVDAGYLRALAWSSLWYRRIHVIPHGGHAPFFAQASKFERVLAQFIRSMQRRHRRSPLASNRALSG